MVTFDQKIAELLNNWTVDGWPVGNLILCVIAMFLCVILCGTIGIEREWRGRSAGLRTHLLVGLGSCMIMIISIYGFPEIFSHDVARLAAQIITGVGFLGAGAIMHRNSGVKGLTTAGTIWVVMAIGIACGSFNFILAFTGTALILFVLTSFKKVEIRMNRKNPTILLTVPADKNILDIILTVSKEYECSVHGLSSEISESGGRKTIDVSFQATFENNEDRLAEYVSKIEHDSEAISIQILGHR